MILIILLELGRRGARILLEHLVEVFPVVKAAVVGHALHRPVAVLYQHALCLLDAQTAHQSCQFLVFRLPEPFLQLLLRYPHLACHDAQRQVVLPVVTALNPAVKGRVNSEK